MGERWSVNLSMGVRLRTISISCAFASTWRRRRTRYAREKM
jgi:hypothetical protein